MLEIIIVVLLLILGIALLTKGSDWLTDSMVPVADKLGTSYIAVATLLVSIMLSIPEIVVAVYAYYAGHPGISMGVVIGSILCNMGLMTGVSAIIKPLAVDNRVLIRDGIYSLVVAIIIYLFALDLSITPIEGIILILLFIPYALNVWFFESNNNKKDKDEQLNDIKETFMNIGGMHGFDFKPGILMFVLGSILLLFGSQLLSDSLIKLANLTHIADVIIGITVGAIGTSIPNIAAAWSGTAKNYTKIAITETFGSNIFTMLVTLGLIAVLEFKPLVVDIKWLIFDIPLMIIMTLMMIVFIIHGIIYKKPAIMRHEGVILLLFYIASILVNVFYFK